MKPVTIEVTDKNLTGHAGLVQVGKFIKKLKLAELLRKHLSISRATNAKYQVAEVVVMLIFGVLAGAKPLSHLALLRTARVIRLLFKLGPVSNSYRFIARYLTNLEFSTGRPGRKCWFPTDFTTK